MTPFRFMDLPELPPTLEADLNLKYLDQADYWHDRSNTCTEHWSVCFLLNSDGTIKNVYRYLRGTAFHYGG